MAATNRNIPLIYPKLQKKFGDVVTYVDAPAAHSRMEFSYDVLQTGRGAYTSEGYHDFIGFNIAVPVLERAFYRTYGQELNTIFGNIDKSIANLRWGVRNLFPNLTKSAFKSNEAEIKKLNPGITAKKFQYKMSRRAYKLEYGKQKYEPKFFARLAVFMIKILPKIGPLKTLKFISPGHAGEKLFANSFDSILVNYNKALVQVDKNKLSLEDIDFDTGEPTRIGEYALADKTYDELLIKLHKQSFKNVTPTLKRNIINYYKDIDTSEATLSKHKKWKEASVALMALKAHTPLQQDVLEPIESDTADNN